MAMVFRKDGVLSHVSAASKKEWNTKGEHFLLRLHKTFNEGYDMMNYDNDMHDSMHLRSLRIVASLGRG